MGRGMIHSQLAPDARQFFYFGARQEITQLLKFDTGLGFGRHSSLGLARVTRGFYFWQCEVGRTVATGRHDRARQRPRRACIPAERHLDRLGPHRPRLRAEQASDGWRPAVTRGLGATAWIAALP